MSGAPPARYAPRARGSADPWQLRGLVLKRLWISAGDPPDAALWDAARVAADTLPAAAEAEGGSSGLGFAVLHRGEAGTWLLLDWWAQGDILCQRLHRADPGSRDYQDVSHRPLAACVWELDAIAHERGAWVRHMMSGAPDPDRYLSDRLPEGLA